MSYLAICIPNYSRLDKLKRLIEVSAEQIIQSSLEKEVAICISDDHSPEDPTEEIGILQKRYPQVAIHYERNEKNKGMDYNFLQSVVIADSKYCWIVGNDDLPVENAIERVVTHLKGNENSVDILVTPFDVYDEQEEKRDSIYPLGKSIDNIKVFDTTIRDEYKKLLFSISHNSGMFGFLSNVVFKRENWIRYYERFQDKLGTIFIQMYMNIQTLEDGAVYEYWQQKIIKNYADDETNGTINRIGNILIGLEGVIEYFFEGEIAQRLRKIIVDDYISGIIWGLPMENEFKKAVVSIDSGKNKLYHRFFIEPDQREKFFSDKDVVVFGAGKYGKQAMDELEARGARIIAIVDSDSNKTGNLFGKHRIQLVDELDEICHGIQPVIVVANHKYLTEMVEQVLEKGINNIAIIT